ncbi:MAG: hypothetical protein RJB26_2246 [Pseudomonadota bacterium]|jgi:hypothetical protein
MATTPENIANSLKMYSVWVAGLVSMAAGYWLQLPVEQQQQILAQWPALKYYSPILAFVAFYAARVLSQSKTLPDAPAPVEPRGNTGEVLGTAGLTTPPAEPVVPDVPATISVQLTASEVASILNAAELLKAKAPK